MMGRRHREVREVAAWTGASRWNKNLARANRPLSPRQRSELGLWLAPREDRLTVGLPTGHLADFWISGRPIGISSATI